MEGRWSLPYSGLGLGLGTGVIRGFADSPSRLWDAYSERARWATRERSRLNASLLIMRGVRLKFLITPFLAILLTACATGRVVHYSPNTTAFQREVLEWMAIGNEALKTGVEPAPLNEREAAYRAWQEKWGRASVLALADGLRDPREIKTRVIEQARVEERTFIDACVRHGYALTEVMGYVDFEKDRLTNSVQSLTEYYIRARPKQ